MHPTPLPHEDEDLLLAAALAAIARWYAAEAASTAVVPTTPAWVRAARGGTSWAKVERETRPAKWSQALPWQQS